MLDGLNAQKRIIVVLGMHRSGTSTITRGLEVLGVDLGERLMPALPGVNEKGFYEDLDVNALNIQLLKELGHDWHTLKPVSYEELSGEVAEKFYPVAINIIRRKFNRTRLFGLKDPRLCRLLPFWQEVFRRAGISASYVIAFRNPLSVVRSLVKRDRMTSTKAYFLWFEEMLASLLYTADAHRVFVEYDDLMADPGVQLQRVADVLQLSCDLQGSSFREYKDEFLSDALRHSRFGLDDLLREETPSGNIARLYGLLREWVVQAESQQARAGIEALQSWLVDLQFTLAFICSVDEERVRMQRVLANKENEFARLKKLLLDKKGHVYEDALEVDQALEQESQNEPLTAIDVWLKHRLPTEQQNKQISDYLDMRNGGPRFAVIIIDLQGDSAAMMTTIKSLGLEHNLYASLQMVVLSTAHVPATTPGGKLHFIQIEAGNQVPVLNQLVRELDVQWLMLAQAGVEFTQSGLMMAALELSAAPDCRAVYGDELQRNAEGALGALFRPAFNLDMLLSFPSSLASNWLFRRDLVLEMGGFDASFAQSLELDMILRLVEQDGLNGLAHVDEPMLIRAAGSPVDNPQEQALIERHLQRRGYQASVRPALPGIYSIDYGPVVDISVSIVIWAGAQAHLLQRCVESLLEKTRHQQFEIILVERPGASAEARTWIGGIESMGESQLRVCRAASGMNRAQSLNQVAEACRGEYLLLLGEDVAAVREDWLDALLNHAQRGEVGVVGGKLLYPNGHVHSAGLLLGLHGVADSPFVDATLESSGYMHRLQIEQNYSAVSGDCLIIRKALYQSVGGLDETLAQDDLADVDLCLKVREQGYLTVWTPYAVLLKDAQAGQRELSEKEQKIRTAAEDVMFQRWQSLIGRDPAYNANLSLNSRGFELEPDLNLTWRPLTWRPLPVVLGHPADPYGCGHYRVIKPFSALVKEGLAEGMLSPGLLHVADLERYQPDVIILQRQISEVRLEAMRRIKLLSKAFKVYELDDYLPNLPLKSVHRKDMPKDAVKALRRGLGYVDRFVVSTHALADAFSGLGLHADIRVAENRLPLEWWDGLSSQRRRGRKPRVGWAGGVSHTGDLELIADVVKALVNEVEWVFFGMCPEKIRPYVQEVHGGVDIDLYPQMLASLDLDLALAPIEDNQFNLCKSNLRLLEYGVCGFPVVCSDLTPYQCDLPVTRVKNRYKDWVDAIRMHINDLDASARMGDELQSRVRQDWMLSGSNLQVWRDAWLP